MKLFKVYVEEIEYDSYDAFVVVAESEEAAIKMVRSKEEEPLEREAMELFFSKEIKVEVIDLDRPGVILESFNAG